MLEKMKKLASVASARERTINPKLPHPEEKRDLNESLPKNTNGNIITAARNESTKRSEKGDRELKIFWSIA